MALVKWWRGGSLGLRWSWKGLWATKRPERLRWHQTPLVATHSGLCSLTVPRKYSTVTAGAKAPRFFASGLLPLGALCWCVCRDVCLCACALCLCARVLAAMLSDHMIWYAFALQVAGIRTNHADRLATRGARDAHDANGLKSG
eukprot:3854591-Amphidinium_carterae.1